MKRELQGVVEVSRQLALAISEIETRRQRERELQERESALKLELSQAEGETEQLKANHELKKTQLNWTNSRELPACRAATSVTNSANTLEPP